MSYTVFIKGQVVICSTPEEVDALIKKIAPDMTVTTTKPYQDGNKP